MKTNSLIGKQQKGHIMRLVYFNGINIYVLKILLQNYCKFDIQYNIPIWLDVCLSRYDMGNNYRI